MADFVAVLKKTLDGLGDTTPATRVRVYDKARSTVAAKLAAIDPPPPAAVAERQKRALEDAIAAVELEYSQVAQSEPDTLDDLDEVFASLDDREQKEPAAKAAPEADPAWQEHETVPDAEAAEADSYDRDILPDRDEERRYRAAAESGDEPSSRRTYFLGAAAVVAVLLIAGGGYGLWVKSEGPATAGLAGSQTAAAVDPATEQPAAEQAVTEPEPAAGDEAEQPTPEQPTEVAALPAQPEAAPSSTPDNGQGKFTQRLNADGSEIDAGPAGGGASIGEGTSVAAATQVAQAPEAVGDPATAPSANGQTGSGPAASQEQPLAVAQRAIFYEERTNVAEGSAATGTVVWSLVQESPGGGLPPEPAIRAEATIPSKDVQLRMTIRRNGDQTLPASHIVEMIFLTPEGFEGGGIDKVLRVSMKGSEQEAGNPLLGIPAEIADGFFLIALNDSKAEVEANMTLLRRQSWLDIPIVYKSGRRALFTLEKGIPGDKVFDEALKAWQAGSG